MCVAIFKPINVKTPTLDTLKMCWDANPDGAGFAYREPSQDGKFQFIIRKGFMKWKHFKEAYKKYELDKKIDTEMIIHFRITTHGGTCKGNCHPFPIVNDITLLKTTNVRTNTVLVHNGILPINPEIKDISDTMELCRRISRGGFYTKPKEVLELLEGFAGTNKLCIMSKYNETTLLGDWSDIEGVKYSNLRWKNTIINTFRTYDSIYTYRTQRHNTDVLDVEYDDSTSSHSYDITDCVEMDICPDCGDILTKYSAAYKGCKFCGSEFSWNSFRNKWELIHVR